MTPAVESYCAICLELRTGNNGWFLLTENRWTDRLKILAWSKTLATQPGVHAACGAEHVQQLVIHWMAVGTLDYPFARSYTSERKRSRKSTPPPVESSPEPDIRELKVFGELAVHRESLERVLNDSPQSLVSILTALISALGGHPPTIRPEEELEEESLYALT